MFLVVFGCWREDPTMNLKLLRCSCKLSHWRDQVERDQVDQLKRDHIERDQVERDPGLLRL